MCSRHSGERILWELSSSEFRMLRCSQFVIFIAELWPGWTRQTGHNSKENPCLLLLNCLFPDSWLVGVVYASGVRSVDRDEDQDILLLRVVIVIYSVLLINDNSLWVNIAWRAVRWLLLLLWSSSLLVVFVVGGVLFCCRFCWLWWCCWCRCCWCRCCCCWCFWCCCLWCRYLLLFLGSFSNCCCCYCCSSCCSGRLSDQVSWFPVNVISHW